MRWRLALVALAVAAGVAGCGGPAPRAYPKDAVQLDVVVLPLTDSILFRTSTYNGLLQDIPNATLRVAVNYAVPSRSVPSAFLDANQTSLDLGARRIVHADLQTKFVDVGDYWWNVTIRDEAGTLVTNASGRYETCFC